MKKLTFRLTTYYFYYYICIIFIKYMIMGQSTNGSEIHRLREFTHYDERLFNRMYRICKPVIKKLSRNIDCRRYDVTPDIIQSYFWDKFMFVYNKYQDQYEEERLKATLLSSLKTFKNKLLRSAYTGQAEFNQDLASFEDIYESGKEWIDDSEETEYKQDLSDKFNQFMQDHLTGDEYLLFRTELDPPPFFEERIKASHGKLSILHLIDFFELPRDKKSQNMLTEMRNHIKQTLELAKTEFKR